LFFHYQVIWRDYQQYAWEFFDSDSDSNSDNGQVKDIDAVEDVVQDAITTEVCDSFLARIPTDKLLWIQEFSDFLLQDIDRTLNLEDELPWAMRYYRMRCNLELSLGRKQLSCFNLTFSRELDSWRHFLLSTSVDQVGCWVDVFQYDEPGPTHLQQKELWLTDALSRVLRARGFRTEVKEGKILMSKGILISACEYLTFKSASFGLD
jgi:hypothetical protein